jgi:urease accessory protein
MTLLVVQAPVLTPQTDLAVVMIRADRHDIARRRWRAKAEDGQEFGFDLAKPLRHGQTVYETTTQRYVLQQHAEATLVIALNLIPATAVGLGWAFGNLHLEASSESTVMVVADTPAARQLLAKLEMSFTEEVRIFRPGHFARGQQPPHELGPSHQHGG